ncbi:leucine-rich repeat neuronal protein 1-like [Plakobranchus ocellatus]|uniref:Leucine-rich repeat neuronal protein 1-like n=1 Tax=Plakobranchus ocellatus TaxID=259542 RepID=A0AAV3Y347_9GAST|nr:leucine-rich repeat neuronal protein 1-like [Plakobranchus ocellatus]
MGSAGRSCNFAIPPHTRVGQGTQASRLTSRMKRKWKSTPFTNLLPVVRLWRRLPPTVMRNVQVVLALVLWCTVLPRPAASRETLLYRLDCPASCVCERASLLPEQVTTNASNLGVISMNCSARGLRQYDIHISVHNITSEDDSGLNETFGAYLEPRLKFLDLRHNNLASVAANMFMGEEASQIEAVVSVDTLDASHNSLRNIPNGSFDTYANLHTLHLSHNIIEKLADGAFKGLESLTKLDLSDNIISDISNSAFASLVNLHTLDLSHNRLQIVGNLHALSSLKYLYLENNRISPVNGEVFTLLPPMPHLEYLDLSSNPLLTTDASMFKGLPHLVTLKISNCSIALLNNTFLEGLSHLRNLRLDGNEITSISYPVFQNTSLKFLSITSTPSLVNISHNAFSGLSQLVFLNLSHNSEFEFVHPNLMSPLTALEKVDLSHCSITLLSQITFHFNLALKRIYLGSNPLTCSCVNAWLAEEINAGNTSRVKDVSACVNSTSGQAQSIITDSFLCQDIILLNTTSKVFAHLGGQILLKCSHNSDQSGLITWRTPRGRSFSQHPYHPDATSHLLTQQDVQPGAAYHKGHYWHGSNSYHSHLSDEKDRVLILADGSLYIDYMLRSDTGPYVCEISNSRYNKSTTVVLYLDCKISGEIKIFAIIVGFLCALGFFTLNIIYVIISWIARRLVNKRRREIIRQMLENMNAYKSTQITRIQENYTYQLGRVRNQYHMQRDRLHRNYTQQVTKMKRGCSNQVEKVRENYTSRLAHLREYSSNQILQIRERANNQIVRIRDYGTSQLEKLRETYKLQHLHVMKLLDTMNLDNCRHIVETECMRAESMMFDVDLLGEDIRTDSPMSAGGDSEYTTPDTSPTPSLEDKITSKGLTEDMAQQQQHQVRNPPRKKILHPARNSPPIIMEMQTTLNMEGGLAVDVADQWEYTSDSPSHRYLMNLYIPRKQRNESLLQLQSEPEIYDEDESVCSDHVKENFPLPVLSLEDEGHSDGRLHQVQHHIDLHNRGSPFMTPEASPTKKLKASDQLSEYGDTENVNPESETDL